MIEIQFRFYLITVSTLLIDEDEWVVEKKTYSSSLSGRAGNMVHQSDHI